MQVTISAHNLTVSDRFRDYVAERAPKIEHFVHKSAELLVKVTRHDHSRNSGPEDELELVAHSGSPEGPRLLVAQQPQTRLTCGSFLRRMEPHGTVLFR